MVFMMREALSSRAANSSSSQMAAVWKSQFWVVLENVETEESHLNDLSHAIDNLSPRQSLKELQINVDALGLPEGADEVLSSRRVNGRLSTNGRVDHGQQSSGDLNEAHPSHVGGSNEANHVTDHTTAESNYNGVAGASLTQQPVLDGGLGGARLGGLAGRDRVGKQSCGGDMLGGVLLEALLKGRSVNVSDIGVGDQDVGGGADVLEQVLGDIAVPQAVLDDDRVLAQNRDSRGALDGVDGAVHGGGKVAGGRTRATVKRRGAGNGGVNGSMAGQRVVRRVVVKKIWGKLS